MPKQTQEKTEKKNPNLVKYLHSDSHRKKTKKSMELLNRYLAPKIPTKEQKQAMKNLNVPMSKDFF
jgi:hypothetical protein